MLSKLQIDAIKPTSKLQKINDSEMLYLFVSPTGRKTWKVLYTLDGKKNTITLGEYPTVLNAKDARLRRDEIKKQVSEGSISLKHSPLLRDWSTTASEGFWKTITDGSG